MLNEFVIPKSPAMSSSLTLTSQAEQVKHVKFSLCSPTQLILPSFNDTLIDSCEETPMKKKFKKSI